MNFVEIGVSEKDYDRAEEYAEKVYDGADEEVRNYKKTSNRVEQTKVGFLGERVFDRWLGMNYKDRHYDWSIDFEPDSGKDFVVNAGVGDKVIDVKTTKRGVSPNWIRNSDEKVECRVFDNQLQKAKMKGVDQFVFVSLLLDDSVGYLLGYLPVDRFEDVAVFKEKGSELASGEVNRFDSFVCFAEDLYQFTNNGG